MKVECTRHMDAGGSDKSGMYDFRYQYDIYRFIGAEEVLTARSYADAPQETHFLGLEIKGERRFVRRDDFARAFFIEAIDYRKDEGKSELHWLVRTNTKDWLLKSSKLRLNGSIRCLIGSEAPRLR